MVPFWKEAMEMVLDVEPGAFALASELSAVLLSHVVADEDSAKIPDVSIVEASAELLYGLVHQRYVLTRAGLHAMVSKPRTAITIVVVLNTKFFQAEKYEAGVFGSCPRVYCMGCNVVPCGRSDLPGLDTVKLFCPNCNDIYVPASSRFQGVDGLFLPHRLQVLSFSDRCLSVYRRLLWHYIRPSFLPDLSGAHARSILETPILIRFSVALSITTQCNGKQLFSTSTIRQSQPTWRTKARCRKVYVPRIYGFKVSERAKSGPRMQWMRIRPESPEELDEVDWRGRWIDDEEDQYDDGIDGEAEEDRRMEDFDPVRHSLSTVPCRGVHMLHRIMRTMMMMMTTMTRMKRRIRRQRLLEEVDVMLWATRTGRPIRH
jgi:casein kinase II subunit beta